MGRGELPWVISGVVPDEEGGLVPPAGEMAWGFACCGVVTGAACCYAAMAWSWLSSPAAIFGSQLVPCTISA